MSNYNFLFQLPTASLLEVVSLWPKILRVPSRLLTMKGKTLFTLLLSKVKTMAFQVSFAIIMKLPNRRNRNTNRRHSFYF